MVVENASLVMPDQIDPLFKVHMRHIVKRMGWIRVGCLLGGSFQTWPEFPVIIFLGDKQIEVARDECFLTPCVLRLI